MSETHLLIIGSGSIGSLENIYRRAFKSIEGVSVTFFDLERFRLKIRNNAVNRVINNRFMYVLHSKYVEKKLFTFVSNNNDCYDVVIIFKGMEFSRRALQACRRKQRKAVWLNINPDDPFNIKSVASSNRNVLDSFSMYEIYCTWSRALVKKLQSNGCQRVEYLPFGYDPEFHAPPKEDASVDAGLISFVGTWDPQREAILSKLTDYNLRIFGNGWDRVSKHSPLWKKIVPHDIYCSDLSEIVFKSAACLNLLRPQNEGAHNMRTFEIPAIGGLMLTTRSEEQNRFFPEGEGCLMFGNMDELENQLDWVLRNPYAALKIRKRGAELVRGHSYVERAKALLAVISDAQLAVNA